MGTLIGVFSESESPPNEYQHDRVLMVFKYLCVPVLWTEVALQELNIWSHKIYHYIDINEIPNNDYLLSQ